MILFIIWMIGTVLMTIYILFLDDDVFLHIINYYLKKKYKFSSEIIEIIVLGIIVILTASTWPIILISSLKDWIKDKRRKKC